jgi:hypothetical protein
MITCYVLSQVCLLIAVIILIKIIKLQAKQIRLIFSCLDSIQKILGPQVLKDKNIT